MASSKFDYSKLRPANKKQKSGFDYSKLRPADEEEQYVSQETNPSLATIPDDLFNLATNIGSSLGSKALELPGEISEAGVQLLEHPLSAPPRAARGVLAGLLEGGKQVYNLPFELNEYLAKKDIPLVGGAIKTLSPYMQKLKIGETGLQKAVMGEPQKGDQLFEDTGKLMSMLIAPEATIPGMAGRSFAITPTQITRAISRHKAAATETAARDYEQLFNQAAEQGLSHAIPSLEDATQMIGNREAIVQNSLPKEHRAFLRYLDNPTLENAHWAQSDLAGIERHLEGIRRKNGLTTDQIRTLNAVNESRQLIRNAMFSENALGRNPVLGERYNTLTNQYRENVVPYTRLKPVSEVEQGLKRPRTAVNNLLKDEQFMIELARRYPGLKLHSPNARRLQLGIAGLTGYEELKKMLGHIL